MAAFRASIFSFKTQLAEMSKRKQVQSLLNTFFGEKQDRESNTTPTTPAANYGRFAPGPFRPN